MDVKKKFGIIINFERLQNGSANKFDWLNILDADRNNFANDSQFQYGNLKSN